MAAAKVGPTTANVALKTVVFLGSSRNITPPWGGDKRTGDRVLKYVVSALTGRESTCGPNSLTHNVTVYDPLVVFGPGGCLADSGAEIQAPTFFSSELSPEVQQMKETIAGADAYIIVTPEYNHSIPPALSGLMGHFGGSCYKYKPCGIVTYSVGPWGGMRAAMALRPFLAELGALSASSLVGLPSVGDMLNEDGTPKDTENRMLKQLPAMLEQVEFLAMALKNQRDLVAQTAN
eukprot:CAMPEP_0114355846 /NCGR_PEP_ID=MMETSP0101-20121206/20533_1 /TAXON_ID=38822 ORGANISM="Pteridomonas danica, Strain PT" /NCGR_SAMPLE_ID=MMETSP0101 /ASSEMBLY_ACC=CAM_ASM_000211 /LENGTH=233 /DNA_ID=CAMNT_0001498013 /DNA_START=27 /DNA_END=728 /DNA_ORIENTATION=+